MGIKTAIEYADSTVNPIMGCTGCELLKDHCYANRLCRRYAGCKGWPKDFTKPEHFPGRLKRALRWKDLTGTKRPEKPWLDGMPRIIFVNDLSDGFCPGGVDADEWLARLVPVMANAPHIWLLLTKWPDRMRRWMNGLPWVPRNFWLGTTVMQRSDEWRIDELLQIKRVRGKRWLSCEPLLGSLDIAQYLTSWLATDYGNKAYPDGFRPALDQVAAGGETGPGARPMHPAGARGLRDQCQAAGVSYFFKSWGEWIPVDQWDGTCQEKIAISDAGRVHSWSDGGDSLRIGSRHVGHLLDGVEWREMPEEAK